jgi:hypothetical protein
MKAEELRIGNWYQWYAEGKYYEYQVIQSDFSNDCNFLNFEPIPLTEEWLVKFGFKKKYCSHFDSFFIGINPVTKDWMFDIVWIKSMINYSYQGFPFYRNGHFRIESVHQLQNLYFALTGTELTIK